jgi:hypothetical protein
MDRVMNDDALQSLWQAASASASARYLSQLRAIGGRDGDGCGVALS